MRKNNSQQRQPRKQEPKEAPEFVEKVIHINRCAKVVKGGRRFSFSALVVVGDQKGKIGYGLGKAKEVPEAIRKATEQAKRDTFHVEVTDKTVPHEALGHKDGGRVLLKPACPGTGVIAGGVVSSVLTCAGIENILTKSLGGSNNPHALVLATVDGLKQMRSPEKIRQIRTAQAD